MPMLIPLVVALATGAGAWAIAGAALVAVGGIMDNKAISTIGGLMSLGAGLIGATGAAAGAAGSEAAATGVATEGLSEATANVGDIVTPGAQASGADAATAVIDTQNAAGQSANLQPVETTAGTTAGQVNTFAGPGGPLLGAPTGIAAGDATSFLSGPGTTGVDVFAKDPMLAKLSAGDAARPGLIQQGMDWIKANPTAANIGAGFLKGAGEAYFKNKSNQELMEIYKQRNLVDADRQALQRELVNRGIANANYVPSSTGLSLNKGSSLYPAGQGPSAFRYKPLIAGS